MRFFDSEWKNKLDSSLKKEIRFILDTYGYEDKTGDIEKAMNIFTRLYSDVTCENVKKLLNSKLLRPLVHFYENHDLDYRSSSLSLYSFILNDTKHYLLFSIIYENEESNYTLKTEKVELFI